MPSGDKVNKVKPTLVQALENVVLQQITCGWSHSVALTSEGEVYVSFVENLLRIYCNTLITVCVVFRLGATGTTVN